MPIVVMNVRRAKIGVGVMLAATLAASCSSSTPTNPSVVTPSTFVMTWQSLVFPTTGVGAISPSTVVITLSNTGTSPVPVASVTDSNLDEFPFTTTCQVSGSLPAASTCNVTARFKPSGLGNRTGTLTVNANGTSQDFALTGTGASINPQLAIAAAGDAAPNVFTLSLTGGTPSGPVELHTTYTPAAGQPPNVVPTTTWTTDSAGNVTAAVTTSAPGTYEHWMIDLTSGISTNHVVHVVQ